MAKGWQPHEDDVETIEGGGGKSNKRHNIGVGVVPAVAAVALCRHSSSRPAWPPILTELSVAFGRCPVTSTEVSVDVPQDDDTPHPPPSSLQVRGTSPP